MRVIFLTILTHKESYIQCNWLGKSVGDDDDDVDDGDLIQSFIGGYCHYSMIA